MIDHRAHSAEKLVPPHPLPYVSRKALKRVTGNLSIPDTCPSCGNPVWLVNNAEIYGREYGEWPYAYRCIDEWDCDSYVGLHPNTDLPLGTLANKEMRVARSENKALFLSLKGAKGWSRKEAYAWLAKQMRIDLGDCHWGHFDVDAARMAGSLCKIELGASR